MGDARITRYSITMDSLSFFFFLYSIFIYFRDIQFFLGIVIRTYYNRLIKFKFIRIKIGKVSVTIFKLRNRIQVIARFNDIFDEYSYLINIHV